MSVVNAYNHAARWGDTASIERLKSSDSGSLAKQAEIENILKNMCMRFERSPNPSTLQLWASDLVGLGYSSKIIQEVCKSIPFKFEKAPTLNQLMALLRPYLAQESGSIDELDVYTQKCFPHLKEKFLSLASEDALLKMVAWVKREVISCQHFETKNYEMIVLCSWMRTYFSSEPAKIIEQALSEKNNDREYLLSTLKRYAREKCL